MPVTLDQFVKSLPRRALLAEQLDGREHTLSCQGGVPLGLQGDAWPERNGSPLFPILCVDTRELPFTPDFLTGSEYLAFFIEPQQYEHYEEDGSLVVRRYPRTDALEPLARPSGLPPGRLALRFRQVDDFPTPDVQTDALERLGIPRENFDPVGTCHTGIKLGGYPASYQTAFLRELEPDYSIQLDMTDLYMYADSGIGFIYGNLTAAIWECM